MENAGIHAAGESANETGVQKRVQENKVKMEHYCRLFPPDYEFEKETLVQLWMAMEFSGKSCEEYLNRCFDILREEQLISLPRKDILSGRNMYTVKHDKFRTDVDGMQTIELEDENNVSGSKLCFHISILSEYIDEATFQKLESFGGELNTLLFIPNYGSSLKQLPPDIFLTLKSVRALDLSGSHIIELPRSTGNLRQLRYLDLSFTPLESLPESIDCFCQLQTLKLQECKHLYELPERITQLTCLKFLDFDVLGQLSFLPKGMRALTELCMLSAFIVNSEEGCSITELKMMNSLRGSCCISGLENVSSVDVQEAALQDKKLLTQLQLRWDDPKLPSSMDSARDIIANLKLNKGLEELHIIRYPGSLLSAWVDFASHVNLVSITLLKCKNKFLRLPLGQLPNLKHLNIIDMNHVRIIDYRFRGNDCKAYAAFSKLENLEIDCMFCLEIWTHVSRDDFRLLSKLIVKECPNLKGLPFLRNLRSLKHLELSNCPNIERLPSGMLSPSLETLRIEDCPSLMKTCSENGVDWHKIKHVQDIWIDSDTDDGSVDSSSLTEDICSADEDFAEDNKSIAGSTMAPRWTPASPVPTAVRRLEDEELELKIATAPQPAAVSSCTENQKEEKQMAEIFPTAFVELLLVKLLTLVSKLFGGGKKYQKILDDWTIELRNIYALLADADRQQCSSEAVKTWLEQLQDVALDMEDVLADFEIQVQSREFSKANASGVLGSLKNMVKKHSKIKQNSNKIEDISKRLRTIVPCGQALGLQLIMQHHTPPIEDVRGRRETTAISKGKVLGRDEEKRKIIELLKDDESDENYVVIPIVGMVGIGKTTLAQSVYNDEQLKGCFDLKAWVCVSDVFDVKRMTTTICKAAVGRGAAVDFGTLDEAQAQLKEVLTGKKFLIVLDDIWNEEYDEWEKLRTPFQYAAKGSRVIMTTRNEGIARMMNNRSDNNIMNVEVLSDDHCWGIFQQHAGNDLLREDIIENYKGLLIKKCKGLPLAAKVLGLLKQKKGMEQLQMVLENDSWSKEENGVLPFLRLSYHYLPSHLKLVFAYCSVLPKDYKFTEMEIILLWMAQGFLPENEEICMEDFGHHYFNDLRSRSLFIRSPDDISEEESFIMHDFIHDLALWAAGGICYENKKWVDNWQRVRHVFFNEDDRTTLKSQLRIASQLRTFYCHRYSYIENLDFIKDLTYIRTLRLCSFSEVLPDCIGELQHLRFLSLKFSDVEELPTSINKLWNLQTLCLRYCSRLVNVPNISSLKKLRHLEIEGTSLEEMPMGFEKVTNLQSLDKFVLGRGRRARLGELKDLNCLKGELRILRLENVSMSEVAREAQLHNKSMLNKLCLEWGNGRRDEVDDDTEREVLEQLEPHSSITKCSLKYYGGSVFPIGPCLNNMVDIHLMCWKKCKSLPELGKLPLLKNLRIEGMDGIVEVGPEFYGNLTCTPPFPTLKSLSFEKMESWERWLLVDNDRAFPCLELLKIKRCNSLQGNVPAHLPSLKKIKIEMCKQLSVSVPLQSLPLLEELVVGCDIQLIAAEGTVEEEHELPHLTTLTIRSSPSLISFPDGLVLPALKTLLISECENMESLPSKMDKYTSLHILEVYGSPKLQCFPEGVLPKNLKQLQISRVKLMAWELHHLHSLQHLYLYSADTKEDLSLPSSVPKISIVCDQKVKNLSLVNGNTTLVKLDVFHCPELEYVVGSLTSLSSLSLWNCPKLQSLPEIGLFLNLTDLFIRSVGIDKPIREWGLNLLTSLQSLGLLDVGRCAGAVERIPDDLELPSSLSRLQIRGFQNLKSISWSTLPNLKDLTIRRCRQLESFADNALPPQLQVEISECDLIKPRLVRDPHGRIDMDHDRWSLR